MELRVNNRILLTDIRISDKAAFVEHLNDKDIYNHTLRIPFPYTDNDAEQWLALVAKSTQEQGRPVHWAIRNE